MDYSRWRTPGVLLIVLLAFVPLQASTLMRRELNPLTDGQIFTLVSSPDPLKNLNPSDPNSHLAKILIPRAGAFALTRELMAL